MVTGNQDTKSRGRRAREMSKKNGKSNGKTKQLIVRMQFSNLMTKGTLRNYILFLSLSLIVKHLSVPPYRPGPGLRSRNITIIRFKVKAKIKKVFHASSSSTS